MSNHPFRFYAPCCDQSNSLNMKMHISKFFLSILLCHNLQGQIKELNFYFGCQFLEINQINEWEDTWNFDPINSAWSAEISANYYPIKNKRFFLQTGIKYHKIESQFGFLEPLQVSNQPDAPYERFRYGFDLYYFMFHISPSAKFKIAKGLNLIFGIGLMIDYARANQKGFQIYIDPSSFDWSISQYSGKYTDLGLSYNLSTSISKRLTQKVSLSLKLEYNIINTVIGEESGSAFQGAFPNQSNITVPIHQGMMDLSGLNTL